jgi:hypothetical protein
MIGMKLSTAQSSVTKQWLWRVGSAGLPITGKSRLMALDDAFGERNQAGYIRIAW